MFSDNRWKGDAILIKCAYHEHSNKYLVYFSYIKIFVKKLFCKIIGRIE